MPTIGDLHYFYDDGYYILIDNGARANTVFSPEQQAFIYDLVVHKHLLENQVAQMHWAWADKYFGLTANLIKLIVQYIENGLRDSAPDTTMRAHWLMVTQPTGDPYTLAPPAQLKQKLPKLQDCDLDPNQGSLETTVLKFKRITEIAPMEFQRIAPQSAYLAPPAGVPQSDYLDPPREVALPQGRPPQIRRSGKSQPAASSGKQRHPPRDSYQDTAVGTPRSGRSDSPARERSPGSRERNIRHRDPLPLTYLTNDEPDLPKDFSPPPDTHPTTYELELPKDLSPEERKRRLDVETRISNIYEQAFRDSPNWQETLLYGLPDEHMDEAQRRVDRMRAESEIETAKYEAARKGGQKLLEAGDQTQTQAQEGSKAGDREQQSRQGEPRGTTERGEKESSGSRTQGRTKDPKKPSSGRSKR